LRKAKDFSLNQWLGLTPPKVVAATLNLDRDTIAAVKSTFRLAPN